MGMCIVRSTGEACASRGEVWRRGSNVSAGCLPNPPTYLPSYPPAATRSYLPTRPSVLPSYLVQVRLQGDLFPVNEEEHYPNMPSPLAAESKRQHITGLRSGAPPQPTPPHRAIDTINNHLPRVSLRLMLKAARSRLGSTLVSGRCSGGKERFRSTPDPHELRPGRGGPRSPLGPRPTCPVSHAGSPR